jgi:thioredoxin reductase/2-polyprenyl-3-methyl-5-hydroxy-6-metoxy-1,4-benzoquinol methylase
MRFDVAVIGGGAAGLSAALILGRARRTVVVVDAGAPRNAPAAGVHGFLSRDGFPPAELLAAGRAEVAGYGGVFLDGEVTAVEPGFAFTVAGQRVTARRLIVTTGLSDELPAIPGLRERWGRDVVHCPYCHGWEFRDRVVGVLGTDEWAVHQALLFRQLTASVVLFAHTAPDLTDEQELRLAARRIRVVPGLVSAVEAPDDRLSGVRLADATTVAVDALAVSPRLVANSALLTSLGLKAVEHPQGIGQHIPADPTGLTSVPGVWVAGNVTDLRAQVVSAAAAGVSAGAAVNADLVEEDTRGAVAALEWQRGSHHGHGEGHAHDQVILFTQAFWDARYGATDQIWSGNPNPHLVTVATDLAGGDALDVGSGEGADAIWLAANGWRVTAVDISAVALRRAAARAAGTGVDVAWEQADVMTWDPAPRQFDLVSAQFMHLPRAPLQALHRRLAAAVRPGGTLLVVGHHPTDLSTSMGRPDRKDLLYTAEEIAATLDPAEWDVSVATPERRAPDPECRTITIHDAVLRAVRR